MSIEQWLWLGFFTVLVITLCSFFWVFAPYFPTRKRHLDLVVKVAKLKPGDRFYELGCGDARVSLALAKAYPTAQLIGLEMAGPLFFTAWIKTYFSGHKNLHIKWKNVFWQNLEAADAVYVFGMKDSLNHKLKHKFLAELKPGARIISYVFTMKDWPGESETFTNKNNTEDKTKITVYTVPQKKWNKILSLSV